MGIHFDINLSRMQSHFSIGFGRFQLKDQPDMRYINSRMKQNETNGIVLIFIIMLMNLKICCLINQNLVKKQVI